MVRHRREGHRLNVVALLEKKLPGVERVLLVAGQHRDDRHLAALHGEVQTPQPVRQALHVVVEAGNQRLVLVGHENVAHGADGIEVGRHDGPAEDVGVRLHLQEPLELGRAADEAAGTREALRQRADDERVIVAAQGAEDGAAALGPDDTGSVGVVDVQHRPAREANVVERGQGGQLARHAVHAVDGDDGHAVIPGVVQHPAQGPGVAVCERLDTGAVRLGDLGAFLDRIVGLFVDDEQVLPADEPGDGAEIGQRHRRVDQRRLGAEPSRQLLLGVEVGLNAGESPRRAVVGAPALDAAFDGFLDARVLVQAEKAVGAEVDHPPPHDGDFAVRANVFDDQVLEVGGGGGKQVGKVLDEADQAVLSQRLGQLPHRGLAHTDVSLARVTTRQALTPTPPRQPGEGTVRGPPRCRSMKRGHQTTIGQAGQGEPPAPTRPTHADGTGRTRTKRADRRDVAAGHPLWAQAADRAVPYIG